MDKQLQAVDPQGRVVVLREAQLRGHIQQAHAEFDDPQVILHAISEASSIWRETRYLNSQVYYKQGAHSEHPNRYVRVVVRDGEVITAHLIDKPRGRSHILIWIAES